MLWFQFIICAVLIFFSGSKLSLYAELVSERTRFSAGLLGIFFLAIVTSLPELVTSLRSVAEAVGAPDLATGDLLGAVIINVFVVALLGILFGKGSILPGQNRSNIFSAFLTIVMLIIIIGFIGLSHYGNMAPAIMNISLGSILLGAIYIIGSLIIYKYETRVPKFKMKEKLSFLLIIKLLAASIIIVASGIWLAHIGKDIAHFYHFKEMSVGLVLVAFATTLPEFTVSFTALKRDSPYMAAGNLLGSNFFNLFIIVILDAVLRKGDFFHYISTFNIIPALVAMALTAIAVLAMSKAPKKEKILRFFSWDSLLIAAIFIVYLVWVGLSFSN